MACPLCGEDCRCASRPEAESEAHVSVLIDPDDYDASEQFFSASLKEDAKPAGAAQTTADQPTTDEFSPEAMLQAAAASAAAQPPAANAGATAGVAKPADPVAAEDAPEWRQEVAERLDRYRNRRRRRQRGSNSLSLDFERDSANEPQETPKVIAFPRPAISTRPEGARLALDKPSASAVEELADPILDSPRILEAEEVEEETGAQPALALTIDEPEHDTKEFSVLELIELPLPVAPFSDRAAAAAADGAAVLAGTAVFGATFFYLAQELPSARLLLTMAAVATGFFWCAYHYLFLVHGGKTPGLRLTGLRVSTFEGGRLQRSLRRGRALALVLSSISLGLGYFWALLDEDQLTWHDRITRTYVTFEDF